MQRTLKLIDALRAKSHEREIVVHDLFLGIRNLISRWKKTCISGRGCGSCYTGDSAFGYKKMDWKEIWKRMRGDLVVDVRGFFDADEVEVRVLGGFFAVKYT